MIRENKFSLLRLTYRCSFFLWATGCRLRQQLGEPEVSQEEGDEDQASERDAGSLPLRRKRRCVLRRQAMGGGVLQGASDDEEEEEDVDARDNDYDEEEEDSDARDDSDDEEMEEEEGIGKGGSPGGGAPLGRRGKSLDDSLNQETLSPRLKGIHRNPNGTWWSKINHLRASIHLGTFSSEKEAAVAFDKAAVILRGRQAKTNFDLSEYLDEHGRVMEDPHTKARLDLAIVRCLVVHLIILLGGNRIRGIITPCSTTCVNFLRFGMSISDAASPAGLESNAQRDKTNEFALPSEPSPAVPSRDPRLSPRVFPGAISSPHPSHLPHPSPAQPCAPSMNLQVNSPSSVLLARVGALPNDIIPMMASILVSNRNSTSITGQVCTSFFTNYNYSQLLVSIQCIRVPPKIRYLAFRLISTH